MTAEPVLTEDDHRAWDAWSRAAMAHARTRLHLGRVDFAAAEAARFCAAHPDAYVAWSTGKDSTALAHLVCVTCGADVPAMSIKDDLDYPGEEEYLARLASEWGVDLEVVHPAFSLQEFLVRHAGELDVDEDFHGRTAALSREAFYPLIDEYVERTGRRAVLLGLRADESFARGRNVAMNGISYTRKSGVSVCQPLARWKGIDVFAYLLSRGIEPLHVYRCVGFHGNDPSRVRKSWWLPGADTRRGGMAWLRRYYPSLFRRLCDILPNAAKYA